MNPGSEKLYSIGEVSERYKLSIHTLRFYEREGLLPSIKRASSGFRKFDSEALEWLETVECLKRTGMTLKEIKQYIDVAESGSEAITKRKNLFYERKQAVLDQIEGLNQVLDLLDFKCWFYEKAEELGSEDAVKQMPFNQIPKDILELYLRTHDAPELPRKDSKDKVK